MNKVVNDYIAKHYQNWLDSAKFKCSKTALGEEYIDVLDEVILQLYNKDEEYLERLATTNSKCGKYKELDVLVLRMININVFCDSAPYRRKYKLISNSSNIDITLLKNNKLLSVDGNDHFKQEEFIISSLDNIRLTKQEKSIFIFKVFNGGCLIDWNGGANKREAYDLFNKAKRKIKRALI